MLVDDGSLHHARITLGTMEEMTKAVQVFGDVLAKKSTAAA